MTRGRTLAQENKAATGMASVNVVTILAEVKVKDRLERKAFEALEKRLEPKKKRCLECMGDGCSGCENLGYVLADVDMRAIELVLSPKFPKTHINVNADLDGMSTESLLKLIEGM